MCFYDPLQDEAAIASYVKALAAEATGKFRHEIVTPVPPVAHPRYATGKAPKHEPLLFDEELKKVRLGPLVLLRGTMCLRDRVYLRI